MHNIHNGIGNKPKRYTINIWKQCAISIGGKITILNNLGLAPQIYISFSVLLKLQRKP